MVRMDSPDASPREISSRSVKLRAHLGLHRLGGAIPPVALSIPWIEPGGFFSARAMSLMDSPAFHLSHSSFLRASGNPGRPSLATSTPPVRTTQKTLPCCTDRLNPPRSSSLGRTGVGEHLQIHRSKEKASYPVSALCRVLRISRSGYYEWKDRPTSHRERENATLTERIREIHQRSRETYGHPRVHAELRALGVRCNRKRVARLMRKDGLRGCMRGPRRKHTTRQDPLAIPAPDLVGRNFLASAPDRLWTADITYLPTDEGFL